MKIMRAAVTAATLIGLVLLAITLGRPVYWSLIAGRVNAFGGGHDTAPAPRQQLSLPTAAPEPAVALETSKRAPEDYKLSPDLVKRYALDNVIMVTWANDHYFDFVLNWVLHLRRLNVTNHLVGAMDDKLLQRLIAADVPTWSMQSGLTTNDFGWGTPTFHKMGRSKIGLIYDFVSMGFDILVSDVDTVWMRDPRPFVLRYPEADILTSSDHLANTVEDDGLEHFNLGLSAANIGIMFVRKAALPLVDEWNAILDKDEKVWDQNAFNDLFRRGTGVELPDRLFMAYDGKLKVGILPVATFASGHTFFVQRLYERVKQHPYVVHATFQFSGTHGKRHRLREAMLWDADPPEYYDPPGGFLMYHADVPAALLNASALSIEGHFALLNHQIRQVRDALALAQALKRTLIVPPLYCGWDRWWAPHGGRIPNSLTELPYLCPMDHVFDVEVWSKSMNADEAGNDIGFREYSILANPRMSEHVLQSRVLIQVCPSPSDMPCSGTPEATHVLNITAPAGDKEVKRIFRPLRRVKILEFSGIPPTLFAGWANEADKRRFYRRVREFGAIWCCVHAHPGHIWYDLLFDVPHTDRHNRVFNGTFPLLTGP